MHSIPDHLRQVRLDHLQGMIRPHPTSPGRSSGTGAARPRMDRRFPSPGVKHVPSYERMLNVVFNIHMTYSSNQLEIVLLSEGEARAAVVWAVPGNPHGTAVSHVLDHTGKRGCERKRPPLARRR